MRILTYNLEFGGREQLDAITAVLQAANPDIIGLTEADDREVVAILAQRLNMHHIWAQGSGDRHIATLSRYPILDWQIHNRKPLTQAALVTTLDIRPFGDNLLKIYNLHLRPYPLWHFEMIRWLAVQKLLSLIRQQPTHPHLIIGDLNTYGSGQDVDLPTLLQLTGADMRRQLQRQRGRFLHLVIPTLRRAGYTDCFRQLHPNDPGFTFTLQSTLLARMDYILADERLTAVLQACTVATHLPQATTASDHFPVIADFLLGG